MSTIWELDFYSRPILDEQQKKVWEVLICESPYGTNTERDDLFRYAQFCSTKEANSIGLGKMIQEAIEESSKLGLSKPIKIRFFRRQIANMITKACADIGIPSAISRRTFTLYQWLEERMATVYPTYPGYQPSTNPSVKYADADPLPLPDALLGQKWTFVTLALADFAEMNEWSIDFGESFPLSRLGLEDQTPIPGLIIYSSRANALAAWMSGLELACVKSELKPKPALILETGASERWVLANLNNPSLQKEADNFAATKAKAKNVHFIAIQTNPESESFAGFWLMQELNVG